MNLRSAIARRVRSVVGSTPEGGESPLDQGDAGFFGPSSVCWRVHGDFTTMMVGGVAALLLQMLHPKALAGVWAHSTFREDMGGRLKRTAQFIAITTYGAESRAEAAITQVRQIHERVRGVTDEGQAYAASDPELLTWIHVCEVTNFLAAWRRYRERGMSLADQDRYFAETAVIALKLGAGEAPRSRAAAEAYLERMRSQLRCDARTREAADAILSPPSVNAKAGPFLRLFALASKDLLPPWAQAMHGYGAPLARTSAVRASVAATGGVLRWALTNGAEARARRRTAAS